jgi:hypothetical protein
MMGEIGKPWQLPWYQLVVFVLGILFSYVLTVIYRNRLVPSEYRRVFFFSMAVSFPFIFFVSWFFNLFFVATILGYNKVVSFLTLILMITILSICVGRLGVLLAKIKRKT